MIKRTQVLQGLLAAAAAVPLSASASASTFSLTVGQIGNNSIAFFPLFVAQEQGYFREAGVDVTITAFQSGAVVGAAMTSGSIDVGCSVITDVFALLKASRPVKIVGSLVNGYYVDVIGSNQFFEATKTARSKSLRDRVLALKGKKIGITGPGSGTEALMVYLLRKEGLDPTRDLELVNVGTDQAAILAAMRTGRIDGVSFAWPLSMVADTQHVGRALVMPAAGDVPAMHNELHGVIYAKPDTIAKKTDAVVAFVRAVGRAEAFIKNDREHARALFKKYDSQLDDETIRKLLEAYLPTLPPSPKVELGAYQKALEFHRFTGFAGATGNAFSEVVDAEIAIRAGRSA
jgi:NitT/TauT family transport system substrate-binding protein